MMGAERKANVFNHRHRVAVPETIRRRMVAAVERTTKRWAAERLGLSRNVIWDVLAPGGLIQPVTLERVTKALDEFEIREEGTSS